MASTRRHSSSTADIETVLALFNPRSTIRAALAVHSTRIEDSAAAPCVLALLDSRSMIREA